MHLLRLAFVLFCLFMGQICFGAESKSVWYQGAFENVKSTYEEAWSATKKQSKHFWNKTKAKTNDIMESDFSGTVEEKTKNLMNSTRDMAQNANKKRKRFFKKKQKEQPEKMVQTKQEWEKKAQNVDLEDRAIPNYVRPEDKDFVKKAPPPRKFVKYNLSPGEREVDLSKIMKLLNVRSQGVIDPDFKYMAYGEYYYTPVYNQISSEIYIQRLKGGITRINKALSTNILNVKREPVISSQDTMQFRQNMFSTLTIVDFSTDSTKLLVKEKIGSSQSGIFRNYVWVYHLPKGDNAGYATRYDDLNEAIKRHWAIKRFLALDNYRWDIKVLGFSKKNPDCVIVEAFAFEVSGQKVYLGIWSLNSNTRRIELISEKQVPVELSINGVVVQEYLP